MFEKIFKLKQNNTTVKTEITAGITTFVTMAYILAVNPNILSSAGMDRTAVLLATCLASFIGTIIMAFSANLPFALSAGMGLNAYFAYTVCGNMGYSYLTASHCHSNVRYRWVSDCLSLSSVSRMQVSV